MCIGHVWFMFYPMRTRSLCSENVVSCMIVVYVMEYFSKAFYLVLCLFFTNTQMKICAQRTVQLFICQAASIVLVTCLVTIEQLLIVTVLLLSAFFVLSIYYQFLEFDVRFLR